MAGMDGIQGLWRQAYTPVQRTAPAERKAAAPARTDTFQSVLTKEERAEQAAKVPDLPNFSKMTDRQKLSALATLHDATDYSGMTDAETYKLINDRFEAAFPHLGAYQSELIGRDSVNYFGTANMARPVTGMSTLITNELSRQRDSQGLRDIARLHREAYYPGMTDGETALAIVRRHPGGTLASQADTLQELKTCGLGDRGKIDNTLKEMRARLVQWAKKSRTYVGEETDNATQEEAVLALAEGRPVHSGGGTDWGALKRRLAETQDDWEQKLAGGYSQYVQSVIDSLVDEIVKGEQQSPAERAPETPEEAPAAAP